MIHSTGRAIFWRLFWKEYRVQRAFWLCIAVLAVVLMALPAITVVNSVDRLHWRFAIARILPALFTAACGAMLFATEREAGTYDFQRSLPLSPAQLLLGKCAFALCSVVALYVVSWLAAVIVSGVPLGEALENPPKWSLAARSPGQLFQLPLLVSLFFALELFLWSVLFSLLLRQPLTAAIAGAAAAAITVTFITWHVSPRQDYVAADPWRLAIVLALSAADVWLGFRWLGEQPVAPPLRSPWRGSSKVASAMLRASSAGRSIARLLWEYWRELGGPMFAAGALIALVLVWYLRSDAIHVAKRDLEASSVVLVTFALFALAVFPLAGVFAFLGDQRGLSYRFLADRGVRSGLVWLSRQLPVWVVAALLAVAFSAIAAEFGLLWADYEMPRDASFVAIVLKGLLVCVVSLAMFGVAAGQFFSMLFRNSFIAAFCAVLFSAVLALWYGLMWLWDINWYWSVLPIPLVLLLATRLRAPSWLAERNTLRAWLPVALVLLLPAATLLTAVPLYRAYQIPAVDVGFPLEEFDRPPTPSEQALDGLYELAYKNFVDFETFCKETKRPYDEEESPWYKRRSLTPAHVAWIDFNQEAIAKALAASRSDDSVYVAVDRQDRAWDFDVWRLARLVILSGVRLEEQGNLDAAIDRYLAAVRMSRQLRRFSDDNGWEADDIEAKVYRWLPYWAARPRQTPARIIAAARDSTSWPPVCRRTPTP